MVATAEVAGVKPAVLPLVLLLEPLLLLAVADAVSEFDPELAVLPCWRTKLPLLAAAISRCRAVALPRNWTMAPEPDAPTVTVLPISYAATPSAAAALTRPCRSRVASSVDGLAVK